MLTAGKNPLSYASSRQRKPLPVRRIILLVVMAAVAFAAFEYRREIRDEIIFLYRQHQWATCVIPADVVVVDTGIRSPAFHIYDVYNAEGMLMTHPAIRDTFPSFMGKTLIVGGVGSAYVQNIGTAYLHENISAAGNRRIVCVDITGLDIIHPAHTGRAMALHLGVYTPKLRPYWMSTAKVPYKLPDAIHWYVQCPTTAHLKIFAGQPDSNDSAHFMIPYEDNGVPGKLDCTLLDDDSVRIIPDRGTGGGSSADPWSPK
jgi:hypothetical protein